jgi:hypothetical protein
MLKKGARFIALLTMLAGALTPIFIDNSTPAGSLHVDCKFKNT